MTPDNNYLVWWGFALFCFIQFVQGVLIIWKMTRPIPPLRELLKEYVTRERFDVFEKANADKFASIEHGISTRLDGLHRSLVRSRESNEELFREIMDRLGKIEGLIEKS